MSSIRARTASRGVFAVTIVLAVVALTTYTAAASPVQTAGMTNCAVCRPQSRAIDSPDPQLLRLGATSPHPPGHRALSARPRDRRSQ